MSNRVIKFRAFDKQINDWFQYGAGFALSWDGTEIFDDNDERHDTKDIVFSQWTGLHDKNGVEVYYDDLILIKFKTTYYDFEGIYIVRSRGFTTVLDLKKLITPTQVISDIHLDAGSDFEFFAGNRLELLSANNRRQSSNDIVVVGNIWQNPELIQP